MGLLDYVKTQFLEIIQWQDDSRDTMTTENLPMLSTPKGWKYGIELPSFILENVSLPPEVEQAIDKRSSMRA